MADETTPTSVQIPDRTELPVIPMRGAVLFPGALLPLTIGRLKSRAALDSLSDSRLVAVVAQRDSSLEEPELPDLYRTGTAGLVMRVVELNKEPASTVALVQGIQRIRVLDAVHSEPYLKVHTKAIVDVGDVEDDAELTGLMRNVRELFREIVEASPSISSEALSVVGAVENASALADLVASVFPGLPAEVQQELLDTLDVRQRMRRLIEELLREREEMRLRDKIRSEVSQKITDAQRRMYLREQMQAIKRELGEEEDQTTRDAAELRERIEQAGLPEEALKEAERELGRLEQIPPASPEYSVARTYLDWLASLPWKAPERESIDVTRAAEVLDEDHYDLEKIKERILEYLAVFELKGDMRGPILCLVGPPGVGKTSLGRSIARAMNREFIRISLGGMHDEAEIRGHRRTYIGAMPGQVIRGIRRAGTANPVFMLDEVDKLGKDFRGDPASALLEVLDPEQNSTFRDNYLDIPYDLSNVLFITTANMLDTVPRPLRDRMEVIELAGYAEEEKAIIARRYIVPRQAEQHGLELGLHLTITDDALAEVIRSYTREAGVRELERKIAAICRKRARQVLSDGHNTLEVTPLIVHDLLGPPRYRVETELVERTRVPGVAVALAWTPVGGEILFIEAARMPRDKGDFSVTGQVRSVMQESSRAALSWLRAHGGQYGIDADDFRKYDVHIHIPSGAVPKDGPSAGVVMAAALASLFCGRPLRPRLAMTGEITLSGLVLPVGGIKEKVLAARRSGIRELVLPEDNRPNVIEDVAQHLCEGLEFHYVKTIEEALDLALAPLEPDERADHEVEGSPTEEFPPLFS